MDLTRRRFVMLGAGALIGAACSDDEPSVRPETVPPDDVPDNPADSASEAGEARLTGWLVTRWAADPFALGSYSYLPVGATPADRAALQTVVLDRLVLAGEHTSTDAPATTHGALASGRRAAAQLLALGLDGPVIVIGAGFAGLGAARDLVDAGLEVVVLEGRDRLGGRAWTNLDLGIPVDLGASWIHGVTDNPVAALAAEVGAPLSVAEAVDDILVDSDGTHLDAAEVQRIEALAVAVVADAVDAADALDADVALATVVAATLDDYELDGEFGDLDQTSGQSANRSAVEIEIIRLIAHERGADLEALSTWESDEGDELQGDEVVLPNGYVQLVEHLAEGIEVRVESTVTTVRVAADGVSVTMPTGTVRGAAVVVTVPLAVLANGIVTFDPPLPATHVSALGRLGMGLLDKVVLQFDRVFWPADVDVIGIDRADGRNIEWLNLTKHNGAAMLVGFSAGRSALEQETSSDEAIVDDALATLRTAFPMIAPR